MLEGTLVAADGELVVERDPAGVAIHVQWPFGVGVHDEGGTLVLADVLGTVKAREGDVVGIAGRRPDRCACRESRTGRRSSAHESGRRHRHGFLAEQVDR